MAPHKVSRKANEEQTSPGISSAVTASVIPTVYLPTGPCVEASISPEAPRVRFSAFEGPAIPPGIGSDESETGLRWHSDDTLLRHRTYFFKDGNVTFLVRRLRWLTLMY